MARLTPTNNSASPQPRYSCSLVVAVLVAILLAACSSGGASSAGLPRSGGSVTVASWQEQPSFLDCNIIAAEPHACAYVNPVMEGLLTVRPNSAVPRNAGLPDYWAPELAVEVPTLENRDVRVIGNRMDVTWKLRHNVRWQDGLPFTSKDVWATFDFWWLRYRDKNPTPLISTSGWDQVAGVETPDAYTAIVHFNSIYAPYLTLGTGPYGILPDHLLEQLWAQTGDAIRDKVAVSIPGAYSGSGTMDKLMVGTGPFMFKEWVPGDHLTLVRNPHWWGGGGRPYLSQIRIKFDTDPIQEVNDLQNNSIDMALDLRPSLLSTIAHLKNVTAVIIHDSAAEHLDLNLHNTFLSDPALRRAILMAIDRQKMIDTLLRGQTSVPPDAWMCIQTGAWCLDRQALTTPYNPTAANKLLDAAGYRRQTSGACSGFRIDSQGRCVALRLLTTTLPLREEQAVLIASDLAEIGIQVVRPFELVSSTKMFGSCNAGGIIYSHNFDLAMYTNDYGEPAEPDSLAYTSYHSSQIPTDSNGCQGQNTTYVSDPQLDQALDAARQTINLAQRKRDYIIAQRRLAVILPEIPLYQAIDVEAHGIRLNGYQGNEFWWMNQTADWYVSQ